MEVREIDREEVTGSMWLHRAQKLHSGRRTIELAQFRSYYRGIQPLGSHFGNLANKLGLRCTLHSAMYGCTPVQLSPARNLKYSAIK
jgi:hypothetical protein